MPTFYNKSVKDNFYRYINPEEILKHENIHLIGVHRDKVMFVVTDQFEDLYNVRVNHFLYETVFFKAQNLILLPLHHFERLAETCGDPAPKTVTLLCGTARYFLVIYIR